MPARIDNHNLTTKQQEYEKLLQRDLKSEQHLAVRSVIRPTSEGIIQCEPVCQIHGP